MGGCRKVGGVAWREAKRCVQGIGGVWREKSGRRKEREGEEAVATSPSYKCGAGVTAFAITPALFLKWRLPTLPLLRSTIGTIGLNFSVRNGKRWNPNVITT